MLAGVLASCGSLSARRGIARDPEAANIEVTLKSDAVPAIGGEPLRSEEGKFYLVRNADGIMAVSFRCTHHGCAAPWKPEQQRFDPTGDGGADHDADHAQRTQQCERQDGARYHAYDREARWQATVA